MPFFTSNVLTFFGGQTCPCLVDNSLRVDIRPSCGVPALSVGRTPCTVCTASRITVCVSCSVLFCPSNIFRNVELGFPTVRETMDGPFLLLDVPDSLCIRIVNTFRPFCRRRACIFLTDVMSWRASDFACYRVTFARHFGLEFVPINFDGKINLWIALVRRRRTGTFNYNFVAWK